MNSYHVKSSKKIIFWMIVALLNELEPCKTS